MNEAAPIKNDTPTDAPREKNMSRVLTEKPARQTCIFKETEPQTLAKLLADLSERLIRGKVRLLRVRHGV